MKAKTLETDVQVAVADVFGELLEKPLSIRPVEIVARNPDLIIAPNRTGKSGGVWMLREAGSTIHTLVDEAVLENVRIVFVMRWQLSSGCGSWPAFRRSSV